MRPNLFCAILTVLLFSSLSFAEQFTVITGGTCNNQIFKKIGAEYEKQTGSKIVFVGDANTNSTEKIFQTVDAGGAEAGCTAGNFSDAPSVLKKSNIEIKGVDKFFNQVIGFDLLQVYLNRENPLTELTDDQLKMIFSGAAKNWKDLGGKDQPISVVYSPSQGALLFFFEKKILEGNKLIPAGVAPENMAAVIPAIAGSPGAVGLTSYGFGTDTVKPVKHGVIGRPLNLFTKEKPSEPLRKFLIWMNREGKKLLMK